MRGEAGQRAMTDTADRDERDLTSTSYTMALIELGYRVTRWLTENAD